LLTNQRDIEILLDPLLHKLALAPKSKACKSAECSAPSQPPCASYPTVSSVRLPPSSFMLLPGSTNPTLPDMLVNAEPREEIRTVRRIQLSVGAAGMLLLWIASLCAQESVIGGEDPNNLILSVLNTMPSGGGYSATSAATRDLQSAVQVNDGRLSVRPTVARPTYCSGATYLVFVQAIQRLLPGAAVGEPLADALAIRGQPDGVGVWGRWNANGPGTACLFEELKLGRNFTSFDKAKPGDFMKIFWTGAVGAREHGHSVVYMGRESLNGVEMVRFWSSNKPGGYGIKEVPRSRISNVIFSRLEVPSNIQKSLTLPRKNPYLASLIGTDSSIGEALRQSGVGRQ
jgi:hypothetical protein